MRNYSGAHLGKGNCRWLGPLIAEKTAFETLYYCVRWLELHNVCVELNFAKGNASEGKRLALQAANEAVRKQAAVGVPTTPSVKTLDHVTELWRNRGRDWAREWLSHANYQKTGSGRNRAGHYQSKEAEQTGSHAKESHTLEEVSIWMRGLMCELSRGHLDVLKMKSYCSTIGSCDDSFSRSMLDASADLRCTAMNSDLAKREIERYFTRIETWKIMDYQPQKGQEGTIQVNDSVSYGQDTLNDHTNYSDGPRKLSVQYGCALGSRAADERNYTQSAKWMGDALLSILKSLLGYSNVVSKPND